MELTRFVGHLILVSFQGKEARDGRSASVCAYPSYTSQT